MVYSFDNVADYYNDQTKKMSDYEYQRWFSRKASIHAYKQTLKTLDNFLQNKHFYRTLEIGCGVGTWTGILNKHSDYILGIDISDNMIGFAEKKNLKSVDFKVMDFLKLDENIYNNYDCLVSMRMLRFIDNIDLFFEKARAVLNDGGSCLIVDVNPLWLKRKFLGAKEDTQTNITLRDHIKIKLKMAEYGFKEIHVRSAVIYLPPPFAPWLKLCDKIHIKKQNDDLSNLSSPLSESYAIYGHL